MTSTTSILSYVGERVRDHVEFVGFVNDTDASLCSREVTMTKADWIDLGSPDKITIRIEPGDTLNIGTVSL